MISFILNNQEISTGLPAGTILLDFIRYHQDLKGTKIGCREGDCGACTVLVGQLVEKDVSYLSFTSCLTPLANVHGKHVVTIEGLRTADLNPIQKAFADESATQCGFCTPGFVVSLAGFVLGDQEPSKASAIACLDGNICRCTGYKSIERAAEHIALRLMERKAASPLRFAVDNNFLPGYLIDIPKRLLSLKSISNGHDPEMQNGHRFLGGGTDLYVQRPDEMEEASVEFLYDIRHLKEIKEDQGQCFIGGETTATDLGNSKLFNRLFPNFKKHILLISSTPIRNMATVAGNFSNASPIGDFTIYFLALNAKLTLQNGKSNRTLPLREYYLGYKQLNKTEEEFISGISFDIPTEQYKFNFEKVSKRTHLDIASVNTALSVAVDSQGAILDASLAAGGVGPVPLYLQKTSAILKGMFISDLDFVAINEVMQTEIAPISDARGSETYKRLLLLQLLKCHFISLFPSMSLQKID